MRRLAQSIGTRYTLAYGGDLTLVTSMVARRVRGHLAIESVRWVLDVYFREDDSRTSEQTLGNKRIWLRRVAVALRKRHSVKDSRGQDGSEDDEHRVAHESPDCSSRLICAGPGEVMVLLTRSRESGFAGAVHADRLPYGFSRNGPCSTVWTRPVASSRRAFTPVSGRREVRGQLVGRAVRGLAHCLHP
jgi:hypothetical protein